MFVSITERSRLYNSKLRPEELGTRSREVPIEHINRIRTVPLTESNRDLNRIRNRHFNITNKRPKHTLQYGTIQRRLLKSERDRSDDQYRH